MHSINIKTINQFFIEINPIYTEELRFKPFYNCQNVKMGISITNSSLDGIFISKYFCSYFKDNYVSIEDEEVVINAQDFQISNSSIGLTLNASTITIPSIESSTHLEIIIINESPVVQYSGDSVIILKDQDIVI